MMEENFLKNLTKTLSQSAGGPTFNIVGGKEILFYGIKSEDRELWEQMLDYRDNQSIQNIIKAKKVYLLTHVIGNPDDQMTKLLKNHEASYGNTMLHDRMVNAHDQSVIKLIKSNEKKQELLVNSCNASDYLLRYYELKQTNALKAKPEDAKIKQAEIVKGITFKDAQGKTPLLLACKSLNQS